MKFKPRDYQEKGKNLAINKLKNEGFFYFNYDMGTGKTFTSLYTSNELNLEVILVIPPKGVVPVWLTEIEKLCDFDYELFEWTAQKVKTKKGRYELDRFLGAPVLKIIIVNIEAFQNKNNYLIDLFTILSNKPTLMILDESSKIKAPKANRTKRLTKMSRYIDYKVCLSGTPIGNSPLDIYTQFEFLKPGFWGMPNWYVFRNRYADLETQYFRERSFKKIVGFKNMNELMEKIKPYIHIVKKEDHLDLPEKIYQTIKIDMSKEQKEFYYHLKEKLWAEYKDKELTINNKVSLFIRFRQITGGFAPEIEFEDNAKLNTLIDDISEYPGKITIFSVFINEIELLERKLKLIYKPENVLTYYGKTKQEDRKDILDKFENGAKILIANPKVAGYGLNLQFCNLCYHFSFDASYIDHKQSEDRFHRIGQKNNVVYKYLICKNTVDERLKKLIENKQTLADNFKNMSMEDVFKWI